MLNALARLGVTAEPHDSRSRALRRSGRHRRLHVGSLGVARVQPRVRQGTWRPRSRARPRPVRSCSKSSNAATCGSARSKVHATRSARSRRPACRSRSSPMPTAPSKRSFVPTASVRSDRAPESKSRRWSTPASWGWRSPTPRSSPTRSTPWAWPRNAPSTWATRRRPTLRAPALAGIHPVLVDPFDHHPDFEGVRMKALADVAARLKVRSSL